ncbi:MAG TPA: MogA/MoaB family molybdenum cofactor biosynthesis protein [Actinobacteria bacterium]|nr:MogA/MoaB family molybdenum cofactor biosynthesis protein [Actinomycetota bacterium]
MTELTAAVVTVSDRVSRGEAEDRSGPRAADALEALGFRVVERRVVPDGIVPVRTALAELVDRVHLVVTSGGTGPAPRDLTPEATLEVVERLAPGFAEAMRAATFGVNPFGMLSRGVAGIAGSTLVLNLPGSPKGVEESLAVVAPALRHAVELLIGESSGHN